ncbi:MAG: hypothetical protein CMI60_20820 [Parvibaculum sp.]|nr:hypothetical protein [Parvibaculum sp.]
MSPRICSILALIAAFLSVTAPASALPQVELRGSDSQLTQIGIVPRLPATQFLAPDAGLRTPVPTATKAEIEAASDALVQKYTPVREKGVRMHLDLYTDRAEQTGKLEDVALTANYTVSW